MKRFRKDRLNLKKSSDQITEIMEMGKTLGKETTRKEAKKEYNRLLRDEIWVNDKYQVNIARGEDAVPNLVFWEEQGLSMIHLSIKRIDKKSIHDWRDLQLIKNELIGEEYFAVEVYPSEADLHDSVNQYHLWVFTDLKGNAAWIPIGWIGRAVLNKSAHGGVQRKAEYLDG